MSDAFISYRREPTKEFANLLYEKLKNKKIDAFIDVQRLERGEFAPQLIEAITNSQNFICLLADGTLDSEWVRKEIQLAYEQRKHFIPVFLIHQRYDRSKVEHYIADNPAIAKLFSFQGVEVHNVGYIDDYVERIIKLLVLGIPYWKRALIGSFVLLLILFFVILINPFNLNSSSAFDLADTPESVGIVMDELSTTVSETATIQPVDKSIIEFSLTMQPIQTDSTADTTASINDSLSILLPEQLAFTQVSQNEDWMPYEREFSGVTMVLVPVGCFLMGSNIGVLNEMPVEKQCISEPFWIDKFEVTQAQFSQFNGLKSTLNNFIGDNLPVERITWFEASHYCDKSRDSRLPTELEWEYAARGPNNNIYPWGNEFIADYVIYSLNSNEKTAPVGYDIREGGKSWVGAMDMSGNILEWMRTSLIDYPYTSKNENSGDLTIFRVIRGGSWANNEFEMRSARRYGLLPSDISLYVGFRCVRDFEG